MRQHVEPQLTEDVGGGVERGAQHRGYEGPAAHPSQALGAADEVDPCHHKGGARDHSDEHGLPQERYGQESRNERAGAHHCAGVGHPYDPHGPEVEEPGDAVGEGPAHHEVRQRGPVHRRYIRDEQRRQHRHLAQGHVEVGGVGVAVPHPHGGEHGTQGVAERREDAVGDDEHVSESPRAAITVAGEGSWFPEWLSASQTPGDHSLMWTQVKSSLAR